MRVRVVCGFSVTMAIFSPTNALSNVLLPALGRPIMETKPERKAILCRGLRGLRRLPRPAHAHFAHLALCGLQDFKAQAVILNDFTRLRNASSQRTHQPADRGGVFGIKMQIEQVLEAAYINVAF